MEEITLRDVFLILRRHARLALGLPLAFVALAVLYTRLRPPAYEAASTVAVRSALLQSRLEEKIELSQSPGFSKDEIEWIALSRPVLAATLRELRKAGAAWPAPGLDSEALAGHLELDFSTPPPLASSQAPPDPLITFTARAPSAGGAALATNAWTTATLAAVNRLPRQRVEGAVEAVSRELDRADAGLRAAEAHYRSFTAGSSLELDSAELQADIKERARLGALIASVRQDRSVTEAQLSVQAESLARLQTGSPGPEAANPDPEFQRLRGSVNDLRASRAQLSAQLAALEARARELDRRVAVLRARVGEGSVASGRVNDELEQARNERAALSSKLADLKIEAASLRSPAEVLTPAYPPSRPAPGAGGLTVALAGVLGLMAGLLLPFLIEAVRDPEVGGAARRPPVGRRGAGREADLEVASGPVREA